MFRSHALDILGLKYEKIPGDFDESSLRHDDPKVLAEQLAIAKAKALGEAHPDALIITADLFAVLNGKNYEKPKDEEEAFQMLKELSGSTFEIISGLCVYHSETKKMLSTVETCEVTFRELTDYEIKHYISTKPVLKFAAAFDADGLLRFAEKIDGNYNFRAGLPVNKLIMFLREFGINV